MTKKREAISPKTNDIRCEPCGVMGVTDASAEGAGGESNPWEQSRDKSARGSSQQAMEVDGEEGDAHGLEEIGSGGNENAPVKIARDPGNPSTQAREEHNVAGHVPYRSWCPICV